jgi:hypothetical protein
MRYDHPTKFESWQILFRYYYIFGFKFWTEQLDREDIPSHVVIAWECFGGTEWKSKFLPFGDGGWKD